MYLKVKHHVEPSLVFGMDRDAYDKQNPPQQLRTIGLCLGV